VDQHAAEVRDSLPVRDHVSLAAYVRGFRDEHKARTGCDPVTETNWVAVDWTRASWTMVRLVALCQLAYGVEG